MSVDSCSLHAGGPDDPDPPLPPHLPLSSTATDK